MDIIDVLEALAPYVVVIVIGVATFLIARSIVVKIDKPKSNSDFFDIKSLIFEDSDVLNVDSESSDDDTQEDLLQSTNKTSTLEKLGYESSDLQRVVFCSAEEMLEMMKAAASQKLNENQGQEQQNDNTTEIQQETEWKLEDKGIPQSTEFHHTIEFSVAGVDEVEYFFAETAYEDTPYADISKDDRPSITMLLPHHNTMMATIVPKYRELQKKCLQVNFFQLALRLEMFFFLFNGLLEEYSFDILQMMRYIRDTDIAKAPKGRLINVSEYDELIELMENLQGQMPDAWGRITEEDLLFKHFTQKNMIKRR